MILRPPSQQRRAAVAPLAAFLMTILVGMVAFTVDVGWIVATRTELQTAADAAALAGADPLMKGYVQYQLAVAGNVNSTQLTAILNTNLATARTKAVAYAALNSAGGQSNLVLQNSDIEFGFTDAGGTYTTPASGFPNTIKVTLRRDSTSNNPLSLFFAPVLGTKNVNITAGASATIMGGTVTNFTYQGQNLGMLPMTFDVNSWSNFLTTGQAPDGSTSLASNGAPQIQVYPSIRDTGNFGQLSLNASHAGESTESGWVDTGIGSAEIGDLQNAGVIPLSQPPAHTWNWVGDTGMKASLIMDINNYTGKVFVLPLFNPYNSSTSNYQAGTGNGSHYYYNIVQFVGVQIMYTSDTNRQVIVQPAAVTDPSLVFGSAPVPAGTTSSIMTTFSYPRLTH